MNEATFLDTISESLDIDHNAIELIGINKGIIHRTDGGKDLVVFDGEMWLTIPDYFDN